MSSNWPTLTLGDVCVKITDGAHNSPKSVVDGKPMASVKDLTRFGVDLSNARLIAQEEFYKLVKQGCQPETGDVLIAKDGNSALDTVCTVDKPLDAVLLSSVAILRPDKEKLDSDFLKYYFCSASVIDYLKNNFISGAAIPRVVLKDFRKAEINVPPLDTQKNIASVLRSLDDKIQLNTQTNQTLEQIAQAIFKSWFVDFEPVKAKMAVLEAGGTDEQAELAAMSAISGKTEEQLLQLKVEQTEADAQESANVAGGRMPGATYAELAQTSALFPSAMEESELGEIPEGWRYSEIGNEVTVAGGSTPSTKNGDFWENGSIHWTTPKDLSGLSDKVILDTDRKITPLGLKKISSGLLPIDTVLMSSRAPVGYLALAKVPVAVNQGYIAMKCTKDLPPEYVIQWCAHYMDDIKQRAGGTTFAEISKKNFKPLSVVVPSADVLNSYKAKVGGLYDLISNHVVESSSLAEIRDSLLPKLLAGDLPLNGD
ncbi:MAG: restriction endonuclease subunit S [Shewanella sp.]|nr:restriction endonuclease subunit S [Shewanella sp.]MCG7937087.1 restriction endonuclease subunit S [Candidatus Thiodiazotropha taylori]